MHLSKETSRIYKYFGNIQSVKVRVEIVYFNFTEKYFLKLTFSKHKYVIRQSTEFLFEWHVSRKHARIKSQRKTRKKEDKVHLKIGFDGEI